MGERNERVAACCMEPERVIFSQFFFIISFLIKKTIGRHLQSLSTQLALVFKYYTISLHYTIRMGREIKRVQRVWGTERVA